MAAASAGSSLIGSSRANSGGRRSFGRRTAGNRSNRPERIRGEDLALPKSWKPLYQNGDEWLPVDTGDRFTRCPDHPNEIRFKPVTTGTVRLVVESAGSPGAIREWQVE